MEIAYDSCAGTANERLMKTEPMDLASNRASQFAASRDHCDLVTATVMAMQTWPAAGAPAPELAKPSEIGKLGTG